MNNESRLRWRCRRGMLELDLLLQEFCDRYLGELASAEYATLERLLENQDQQLMEYLFGRVVPADVEIARLVTKIRTTAS